jgi:hypothetical protein
MTKNSAHKKAARAYQANNPGTALPEALRATKRPSAAAVPDRDTPGEHGSGCRVWNFDNPKLAALVQSLATGGGFPAAAAAAGHTLPPAGQTIGDPIYVTAAQPGDIVVAGGTMGVVLGAADGQTMVLTDSGAVTRLADVGQLNDPECGIFRLSD